MGKYDELRRAAAFDADRTYPSLFQHLGYRRCIAEQLLKLDNYNRQHLIELYNHINKEIKLILGLDELEL